MGRSTGARAEHAAALGLASQAGDQAERARAHDGLARSYQADGDPARARGHWQQALNLYTELGDPAAQQVRARLSAADGAGQTPDGAGQTADRCGTDPAIPSG
jgi:tetratricopeptide (TPR) repeat protein